MMRHKGFTLIELLIVIAIIAILALIAIPNFLEAQTRAKVSRTIADMRSLATALEAYQVDQNAYPPYGRIDATNTIVQFPATVNAMTDKMCFVSRALTTPVAFVTRLFEDPFFLTVQGPPSDPQLIHEYEYLNLRQHVGNFVPPPPPFAVTLIPAWGEWRMVAAGPDQDRGMDIKSNKTYDPTNGTISDGDIVRCQLYADQRLNTIMK